MQHSNNYTCNENILRPCSLYIKPREWIFESIQYALVFFSHLESHRQERKATKTIHAARRVQYDTSSIHKCPVKYKCTLGASFPYRAFLQ